MTSEADRRANAAPAYRDGRHEDAVEAASSRATTVARRFGITRYALTRPVADETSGERATNPDDPESAP